MILGDFEDRRLSTEIFGVKNFVGIKKKALEQFYKTI